MLNISKFVFISSLFLAASLSSQAAPLPNDTILSIAPGVVSGGDCVSGSCFGLQTGSGPDIQWWPLTQGSDGGIVIGKNQLGGLQNAYDYSPWVGAISGIDSFVAGRTMSFTTTAITGALSGSAPTYANLNIFDDTSCSGAACIGKTVLGTMNIAYNNVAYRLGSDGGCVADPTSVQCTTNQLNGILVNNWSVNSDNSYSLDYNQIIRQVSSRSFPGGAQAHLHLEGSIELPDAALFTVGGSVTRTSGSPLQEAINIDLYNANGNKWSTTTDLNGNYSLQLPNGTYQVDPFSSDDYSLLGTNGNNLTFVNDADVDKDLVATSLKVTLVGILSINGSVKPYANLIVHDGSGIYTSTTTSDQGFFKLKLLPSSYYNIQPASNESFVIPGGNGVLQTIADPEGTMYKIVLGN
jgi:hypothetical protein